MRGIMVQPVSGAQRWNAFGATVLLVLSLLLALVPSPAAAFAGGNGTSGNPYQISTCTHLQNMSTSLNSYYVLINNIDCSDTVNWNSGAGFAPIGSSSPYFTGQLDGDGYTISSLTINRSGTSFVGLFGRSATNFVATDIILSGANITGSSYAGGLVGYATNGAVTNVTVNANINNSSSYSGGILGGAAGTTVTNVSSSGTVSAAGANAGGLIGYMESGAKLYDSDSSMTVNAGTNSSVGGAVGSAYMASYNSVNVMSNSYATGAVTGGSSVGGFVGNATNYRIVDAYATGAVTGGSSTTYSNAGGFIGWSRGNEVITNTYATGSVTSGAYHVGGYAGGIDFATVQRSFATGDVTGNYRVGGFVGVTGTINISDSYARGDVIATGNPAAGFAARGNGTITRSYSTGAVSGSGTTNVYGFAGDNQYTYTCNSSFWDTQTSGKSNTQCSSGATGRTTAQMQSVDTFTVTGATGLTSIWDFANNPNNDSGNNDYWAISPSVNDGYPYLSFQVVSAAVTTSAASSINTTTALLNGNVTSQGASSVTARGFVWDTVSRSNPGNTAPGSSAYANTAASGTAGLGSYSQSISSLNPGTTYYARAYATNATETVYGSEVSLLTLRSPTLTYPQSNSATNSLTVEATTYSAALSGTMQLILSGSSTVTLTLTDLGVGTHSFTINPANVLATAQVAAASQATIPDGTYTVTFQHRDAANVATLSAAASSVKIDTTAPTLTNLTPANGATQVSTTANLLLKYDEPVGAYSGNIVIHKVADDTIAETIPAGGGPLSGSGTDTITVNPFYDFEPDTEYYVLVDALAITDLVHNSPAGITSNSAWRFRTAAPTPQTSSGSTTQTNRAVAAAATVTTTISSAAAQLLDALATGAAVANDASKIILNSFPEYSQNGKQIKLAAGQIVYFQVRTQEHSATVKTVSSDSVVITVASKPRDVQLRVGQSVDHDVNEDNQADVRITLAGIANGVADIRFMQLAQTRDTVQLDGAQQEPKVAAARADVSLWLVLLAIILVPLFVYRRRTNRRH